MIDRISKEDILGRRLGWMIVELEIQAGCLTPSAESEAQAVFDGPV